LFLGISILEAILIIVFASFKFALSIPLCLYKYQLSFQETVLITSIGGILGILFFALLSNLIIKFWKRYYVNSKTQQNTNNALNKVFGKEKKEKKKKKVFTRRNKMIIKTKKSYGLIGLSIITPFLLSIPVGTFIILRYFPNQKKSILYLIISVILWSVIFSLFFGIFVKVKI